MLCVDASNINTSIILIVFQCTLKMARDGKIHLLYLMIIKTNEGENVSDCYRKPTFSGRTLSFLSTHQIQNKIGNVKKARQRYKFVT